MSYKVYYELVLVSKEIPVKMAKKMAISVPPDTPTPKRKSPCLGGGSFT